MTFDATSAKPGKHCSGGVTNDPCQPQNVFMPNKSIRVGHWEQTGSQQGPFSFGLQKRGYVSTVYNIEKYVITSRSIGERCAVAGLRVGCMLFAKETGRHTLIPIQGVAVWLQSGGGPSANSSICPVFATLDPNFYPYSLQVKAKFIIMKCTVPPYTKCFIPQ